MTRRQTQHPKSWIEDVGVWWFGKRSFVAARVDGGRWPIDRVMGAVNRVARYLTRATYP